jgi:hypothetical protein
MSKSHVYGQGCLIIVCDLIIYVSYLSYLILCMNNLTKFITFLYHICSYIYVRGASHILYMLHNAFKCKLIRVQILWGSYSNMCGNISYMLIIIIYEL